MQVAETIKINEENQSLLCKLTWLVLCKVADIRGISVGNEAESFKSRLNRSMYFTYFLIMHILDLYYFVVRSCVPSLEQEVLCSVAIFQTSQRLNILSLGCVFPTSTLEISLCAHIISYRLSRPLCMFQSILCSNPAHKSPSPSHWNVGWDHISIPCSYSLHSKHLLLLKIAKYFLLAHAQQGGLQTRGDLRLAENYQ